MTIQYECQRLGIDGVDVSLHQDATVTVAIPPSDGHQWRVEVFVSPENLPAFPTKSEEGKAVQVVCRDVLARPEDGPAPKRISGEATLRIATTEAGGAYVRLEGIEIPIIER